MANVPVSQSYESAPNSDEYGRIEELESPPGSAVPSSYYPSGIMPSTDGGALRPTSVYAYPLTPPMEHDPQFADAPTPFAEGGTGSPKPHHLSGRAKSLVPAAGYKPYHNRFARQTSTPGGQDTHYDDSPAKIKPAMQKNRAEHEDEQSYYQALGAAPEFPPAPSSGQQYKRSQQQQLGAAFQQQAQDIFARPGLVPRSTSSPMPSLNRDHDGQHQRRNASAQAFSGVVPSTDGPPGQSLLQSSHWLVVPKEESGDGFSQSGFIMSSSTSDHNGKQISNLKRSPSRMLASAMAKHKAQREAAGLTTDGEYYVDPKSGKHYFVASTASKMVSGQKGKLASGRSASEDKENHSLGDSGKKGGRRKLAKKDAKWQLSQVKPQESRAMVPQGVQPQQQGHVRTPSRSAFSVHSNSDTEGTGSGFLKGKKWKPWAKASSRSASSREGTPTSSPQQLRADRSYLEEHNDDSQEWLHEGKRTPNVTPFRGQGVTPSPGSAASAYGGMLAGNASPASLSVPTFAGSVQYASSHGQPDILLSAAPGRGTSPTQRPPHHNRTGSLYSNYSYYGLPPSQDGHTTSPARSPTASPVPRTLQPAWDNDSALTPSRSRDGASNVPLSSPYIAPTGAEFQPGYIGSNPDETGRQAGSHSRQPSTTLDKAKAGIKRSGSLQLLAPAKQSNLTIPKASHGPSGRKNDELDLSALDPNDPLACLHLGIDAHERGRLEESASFFAKSANGGCGLGMLMYGLTLRHGWVN